MCETRLANLGNRDEKDRVPTPVNARVWNKRRRWLTGEYPEEYRPVGDSLPDQELAIPDTAYIRDSSLSEEELMEIWPRTLDAPEQGEDSLEIGGIYGGQQHGHVTPEGTYVDHCSLICERITERPAVWPVEDSPKGGIQIGTSARCNRARNL